jgi:hypothetical protein
MNNYYFITHKERSEYIVKELGDKITVEEYDEESNKITFNDSVGGFELLVLFHAGIRCGRDGMAKALGVGC